MSRDDPQAIDLEKVRRRLTVSAFLAEWEPSEDPSTDEDRDRFRHDVIALLNQELDYAMREVLSEKADWSINTSGAAACYAIERRIDRIRLVAVSDRPRWDQMTHDSKGNVVQQVDYWYTETRSKDAGGGT